MKRIIIYILVFSTFMAPMAWALDSHDTAFEGHTEATLGDIDPGGDNTNTNHDTEQSDHCDHGLAHLTTLLPSETFGVPLQKGAVAIRCINTLITISLNPPFRPPIG